MCTASGNTTVNIGLKMTRLQSKHVALYNKVIVLTHTVYYVESTSWCFHSIYIYISSARQPYKYPAVVKPFWPTTCLYFSHLPRALPLRTHFIPRGRKFKTILTKISSSLLLLLSCYDRPVLCNKLIDTGAGGLRTTTNKAPDRHEADDNRERNAENTETPNRGHNKSVEKTA